MVGTRVSSVPAQGESGDGEPAGPVGEGVDRSTLQLVANLFPAETRGRVFFARFLERAAVEKSVIPDATRDTVYICTQSIATLGGELGLSNDTTHKYVKLYMALGLLRKQKFMGRLAFLLFVGIYHPPQTLEGHLDSLIQHSRPKLRTMAMDVKARCQIYGLISQDLLSSLEQLQALLHVEKGTSRRTLEQRLAQAQYITSKILRTVLTSHLPAESPQTDGTRRRQEHILLENLPKDGDGGGNTSPQENQESPRQPDSGRPGKERLSQNLRKGAREGDSGQGQLDEESPQRGTPGKFSEEGIASRLPEKANQRDSGEREQEGESPQDDVSGRFDEKHGSSRLPGSLPQGDSGQREQEGESPGEGEPGRFPQPGASLRLPRSTDQGDSGQGDQRIPLAESPQEGKARRRPDDHLRSNLPEMGRRKDSGSALRNVHVENICNFIITCTLREPQRVAMFLAEQLEGDRRV